MPWYGLFAPIYVSHNIKVCNPYVLLCVPQLAATIHSAVSQLSFHRRCLLSLDGSTPHRHDCNKLDRKDYVLTSLE